MFCEHCRQICKAFEDLLHLIKTGLPGALDFPDEQFEHHFCKMQLSMKDGCEFCMFIVHCLESDPRFKTLKASSKESSSVLLTLSFHAQLGHQRHVTDLCFLKVKDQEGRISDTRVYIEVFTKDEPNCLWGSYISADPLSEASVKVANRWWKDCRSTHSSCNQASSTRLPSRVIQIKSLKSENESCLMDASTVPDLIGNYATLSHCWGNGDRTTLRRNNLTMMQTGFARSSLSQQFQDAIKVAEKLEIQYIWIDCICIIQDSEEDLSHELAKMGDIYANSALTIAGPASPNSATSFLKTRDAGRYFVQLEGRASNLYLRKPVNSLDDVRKNGLLNSRGWVFQEMQLTSRALLYGIDQMHWRCREMVDDENHTNVRPVPQFNNLYHGKKRFLQLKSESGGKSTHISSLMRRTNWYTLVDKYSGKRLSLPSDKLPAISAIAQEIGVLTGDVYLAGIWKRDLVNGLLWRRDLNALADLTLSPEKLHECQRLISSFIFLEDTGTPSWSWAAYHGKVYTCRLIRLWGPNWSVVELVQTKEASVDLVDPKYLTGPVRGGRIVLHGVCRNILLDRDDIRELQSIDPFFILKNWRVKVPLCAGTILEIAFDLAKERVAKESVLCLVMEKLTELVNDREEEDALREWHCLILRRADLGSEWYRRVGVGRIEPGYVSRMSWRSEDGEWRSEDEKRSARDKWRWERDNWMSELNIWRSETIVIV